MPLPAIVLIPRSRTVTPSTNVESDGGKRSRFCVSKIVQSSITTRLRGSVGTLKLPGRVGLPVVIAPRGHAPIVSRLNSSMAWRTCLSVSRSFNSFCRLTAFWASGIVPMIRIERTERVMTSSNKENPRSPTAVRNLFMNSISRFLAKQLRLELYRHGPAVRGEEADHVLLEGKL